MSRGVSSKQNQVSELRLHCSLCKESPFTAPKVPEGETCRVPALSGRANQDQTNAQRSAPMMALEGSSKLKSLACLLGVAVGMNKPRCRSFLRKFFAGVGMSLAPPGSQVRWK